MINNILDQVTVCPKCDGKRGTEKHLSGMIHYETDSPDECCPSYHWEFVPCVTCNGRGVVLKEVLA